MKALKIYEALSFERNKDPKESMGIGSEEFRMVNKLDKELSPLGFIKNGKRDMRSQSDYMKSIESWIKKNDKTFIHLYFVNWYGSESYKFSIHINGYSYYPGREITWWDFEHRWDSWREVMEIMKVVDLKPGSILKAKDKCIISSKKHEFRSFPQDQRKMDYIIEKGEQIEITNIDFDEPSIWGGIKVYYNNNYFIGRAESIWSWFEIIKL
jgi:hypothetical protein